MKATLLKSLLAVLFLTACVSGQNQKSEWRSRLEKSMPLLGHRNWILVVDSAYPLQNSQGVETIETDANQLEVVHAVLAEISRSPHVRPAIFMDAELPFVSDTDAPGVTTYRQNVMPLLREYPVNELPHEKLISMINDAGKTFQVLVLKTNMTIPYTSVFIRLDCKYWSDEQEKRLREKMGGQ